MLRDLRQLIVATVVAAALLPGCGGGPAVSEGSSPTVAIGTPVTVARTTGELAVHASPDAARHELVLPATTSFGSPRALLVVSERGDRLEVLLPLRPNGRTGWIDRAAVDLHLLDQVIHVDLAARELTLHQDGEEVLRATVAVGSPDAPTPTGTFSVVDKLATGDDAGPYGPYALGLSGHSEVLTEFAGGEGQIGIHGTSDPASIGRAVSHGCVRVPNHVVTQLNDLVVLGAPVVVV